MSLMSRIINKKINNIWKIIKEIVCTLLSLYLLKFFKKLMNDILVRMSRMNKLIWNL